MTSGARPGLPRPSSPATHRARSRCRGDRAGDRVGARSSGSSLRRDRPRCRSRHHLGGRVRPPAPEAVDRRRVRAIGSHRGRVRRPSAAVDPWPAARVATDAGTRRAFGDARGPSARRSYGPATDPVVDHLDARSSEPSPDGARHRRQPARSALGRWRQTCLSAWTTVFHVAAEAGAQASSSRARAAGRRPAKTCRRRILPDPVARRRHALRRRLTGPPATLSPPNDRAPAPGQAVRITIVESPRYEETFTEELETGRDPPRPAPRTAHDPRRLTALTAPPN